MNISRSGLAAFLRGVAASFAALGLVYKALRFIKLLLAGSENEFLATLFADESLVFVHVFLPRLKKVFCPRAESHRRRWMKQRAITKIPGV